MANTYTYSGPATRWSEGDPTAVDYLNVSRVNSDHLYEALNTILVTSSVTSGAASTLVNGTTATTQGSSDNTTKIATTAYVTTAVSASSTSPGGSTTEIQYNNGGAFGGSANLAWTNGTSTLAVAGTASAKILNISASGAALGSQDASKIILVDLNDPATLWDVEEFLVRAGFTSWYQELGAPPMRGAIFLNNAKTSIIWWNLDTDTQYIKFDAGGSSNDDANMTYLASNLPTSIAFLDGKIYFGLTGGGAWIIDFLRDECIGWFESGQRKYEGNIEERNDGKGNYSTRTSLTITDNIVNGVAAGRDALSTDEFGRPKHWVLWSTDEGSSGYQSSMYNPINDAMYYPSSGAWGYVATSVGNLCFWRIGYPSDVIEDAARGNYFTSAAANAFPSDFYLNQVAPIDGHYLGNDGNSTITDLALSMGGNGYVLATAMEEGLGFTYLNESDDNLSGHIFTTSTYQTPYMKGLRFAAYPLIDLNDRSKGTGYTLTNGNSVVFTGTSPFGLACSAFTRGSDMGLNDATNSPTVGSGGSFTVSAYFKSSTAFTNDGPIWTNAYSSMYCAMTIDSGQAQKLRWVTQSDSGGGSNIDQHSGGAVNDGEWHHGVGVLDADKGLQLLYLDGVLVASSAWTKTYVYTSTNGHSIGGKLGWWTDTFDGNIAQVSLCESAWTPNEVQLEYQRMVRGVGGATATLANTDVKSVRVDQNTGLAAVTTAANQTEIWDVEMGLRQSIDGTNTATIADADVRLKTGATLPEYITARSGAIEFDGQTRSVS
jgi:hypothetical protein